MRPRIGFAVAKKKISLAVQRNRIRRLARESFRLQQQNLASVDIVVLAQAAAAAANNKQLSASLEEHWQKINSQAKSKGRPVARTGERKK